MQKVVTAINPLVHHLPASQRFFNGNRHVYCVLSQRAGGLCIGVNMNLNAFCSFKCLYCEVDRQHTVNSGKVKVPAMVETLKKYLALFHARNFEALGFADYPPELLRLTGVALSGDGEPTLCQNFSEVVGALIHLRAGHLFPRFKITLITNATGLHLPDTQAGLAQLDDTDEIWAKLDAGTEAYHQFVSRSQVPLELVLANIADLASRRPVIIQSLFAQYDGVEPTGNEISQYAGRLRDLKKRGAKIPLVQLYSAHRPAIQGNVAHLSLRSLSSIARRVREISGLTVEVF